MKRNRPLGNYHKKRTPEFAGEYNKIIDLYIQGKITGEEVSEKLKELENRLA
ncbi:MAG: hypothetical protein WC364_14010 [Eubacteriales bacterium]|jgi:hypothetical protein